MITIVHWFLVLTLFCNVNVAMKENGLEKTILEAQKLTMTCITAYTKGWHIYILNLLYHNLIQYKKLFENHIYFDLHRLVLIIYG